MARSKSQSNFATGPQSALRPRSVPATVSGRWLLTALGLAVPAAVFCTWTVFCLLFWQGSWQLLYHATFAVAHTPSEIGLAYDPVEFASTDTGIPQLRGWWIPAPSARYTVLYLHDQAGNIGDTLNALADLHASGLNVLVFDYRGYGQSKFERPSEARWRQDATWALDYLTGTRHIDPHSIVAMGIGLGANLALEIAAAHPELAGVILESPLDTPANAIFNDPRARLVPVHLLVSDRYDLGAPASALRVPSLWLMKSALPDVDAAFANVKSPKTRVALPANQSGEPMRSWLADLPTR
jgi:pimeloyl-ACP methyl ester carboxylesterase